MTASHVADATVAEPKQPMGWRSSSSRTQRLVLGALASRDLERGAEVGERVTGAKLPARLVQVEADDRAAAASDGDRGEQHDVVPAHRADCR